MMDSRDIQNPSRRDECHLERDQNRTVRWHNARLPYGIWDRADGSQVLFDRTYVPQLERDADGGNVRISQPAWVKWAKQRWFWGSGPQAFPSVRKLPATSKARQHGEAVVAAFVAGESIDPFVLDPTPEG